MAFMQSEDCNPVLIIIRLLIWGIKSYHKKDATIKENLVQNKPIVTQPIYRKDLVVNENLEQYKLRLKPRTFEKWEAEKEILVEYKPSYYAHVIDLPVKEENQSHLVLLINNKYKLQATHKSPLSLRAYNNCGNKFLQERREYMSNLN